MKTLEEIEKQKQDDRAFIVSAVTVELHNMAYLEYFDTWENEGGMGWFFDLCVEITDKIMFTEGSQYLKWLDHWIKNEEKHCDGFSEITGETCFDWYHMNEALKVFQSRYKKDECSKEQVSEHIGHLLNIVDTDDARSELVSLAKIHAKKEREIKQRRVEEIEKQRKIEAIVQQLNKMDIDGEGMQQILEKVGLDEQMFRQLSPKFG